MQISKKQLNDLHQRFIGEKLTEYDNWSKLSTIGVGRGKCVTIEPSSVETLIKILKYTKQNNINVLPLGAGSNTIGTDISNTFLIIKLTNPIFKQITIKNDLVTSGAGIKLPSLIKQCAEYNLGGIAELAGIPGNLGGSIRTNAGRSGICIFDVIEKIKGYKFDGSIWEHSSEKINSIYRYSDIPKDVIITELILKLKKEEKDAILSKVNTFTKERNSIYPKKRNAGCIFKNPSSGHGAGKLIDLSGCKNIQLNSLKVSNMHANFIINESNSSTSSEKDFLELTMHVRKKVYNFSGIYLIPEVYFVNNSTHDQLLKSPTPLTVAILKGGECRERAVSLESASNVADALRKAGYIVKEYDITSPKLPEEAKHCNVVFPVLHGGFGENGEIQKKMEEIGIPFVGCGSKTSSIAIDKTKSKDVFRKLRIPTPKDSVIDEAETNFPENLSLPVVVKPPQEGSTFGITIVRKMSEWLPALKKAAIDPSEKILIEEYIDNIELTAGVFNGIPLPLVHISYPGEMYDYDAKYTHNTGETLYISPPNPNIIPKKIQDDIQKTAVKIYDHINAKHLLRIDILLDKRNMIPYFLEINNIPGFTSSSLFPKAAAAVNIPYIQVCSTLVKTAFEDYN
jgi:UDP-N-acetylenolpyruvoylglucosamine reductase